MESDPSIEAINEELDAEFTLWRKHGIDPINIHINGFMLDMQVHSLINYLIDNNIVDKSKLELEFKQRTVERLRELRREIVKQQSSLARTKPILDPNGRPFL